MFNSIDEAIKEIQLGQMIIVVDDDDRENEGDFIMAGDWVTPDKINFMATYGRGLICTPIDQETAKRLDLHPMVSENTSDHETPFTVSIDLKNGISTGISSPDRARTIQQLSSPHAKANDFVRPGHIFPLIGKPGGVLERNGHTEASLELTKLAGLNPTAVICEIMNEDGTMARVPELQQLAKKFNLVMISIADLQDYLKGKTRPKKNIERVSQCSLPTSYGDFELYGYEVDKTKEHHLALVKDKANEGDLSLSPFLVRIHSECLTGDIFASKRCDCGEQLSKSLCAIEKQGRGALIYLRQEGRGIGLINKIKAYELMEKGFDTVEANIELGFQEDERHYHLAGEILKDLGIKNIDLLTNNPQKVSELMETKIKVCNRVPIETKPKEDNLNYLLTKKEKMGHMLNLEESENFTHPSPEQYQ